MSEIPEREVMGQAVGVLEAQLVGTHKGTERFTVFALQGEGLRFVVINLVKADPWKVQSRRVGDPLERRLQIAAADVALRESLEHPGLVLAIHRRARRRERREEKLTSVVESASPRPALCQPQ